ncbi:MAG: DEAD/DEAH box helicase family protein [Actinobacteria bacterium]|nr:DEAD/DEAH box helicase family protein [Actinomycetota bacterium]
MSQSRNAFDTHVQLRAWQRAAFDKFAASEQPDFLAVATPGAGKTTFALACARWALAQQRRRLIVVAPTTHLKAQWVGAAHSMGLQLDHSWSPTDGIAQDVHGIVTTYQQVAMAATAKQMRGLAADAFVILDEVHHAGDERAWGDGVRTAFELAARRLSLSGTPFRSDTASIPFVRYEETGVGGEAQPDFTYGYADALRDGGVVRPVYFPRFDGLMEWNAPDGSIVSANFHDDLDRTGSSHRLRSALSLEGDWLAVVIGQAHDKLMQIREQQPDAGALAVCMDQDHARDIARFIRTRLHVDAEVVVSDDPAASAKIAAFGRSDRPWLVAVRMVSEGVDIPRLRVGVYASTVVTELFFRQAVGRLVRWIAGVPSQKAYVYLPDDPRLRSHAFQIAEARRHVLRPAIDHEAEFTPEQLVQEAAKELGLFYEQLSLFSVLSSTATGMTVHAFTEHGITYDDEPDVPEPDDSAALGDVLVLPEIPTDAGFQLAGSKSVADQKALLREQNLEIAKRLVDLTGWSHSKVQKELNRLAGIESVGSATNKQLERRARLGEGWLARR